MYTNGVDFRMPLMGCQSQAVVVESKSSQNPIIIPKTGAALMREHECEWERKLTHGPEKKLNEKLTYLWSQ